MSRAVVGYRSLIDELLLGLFAGGNILLEAPPGLGKTLIGKTLAQALSLHCARIQFTPDLMPADIVGTNIIIEDESGQKSLVFQPGPVFTHLLLADEINRATPKTQSALLEAMNEGQVTIDGRCHPLPLPFMVIATQNPVEHHGTYPLPESQLDRFLMRLRLGYPDPASEREIVRNFGGSLPAPAASGLAGEDILRLQESVHAIAVDEALVDYMLAIVEKTRSHEALALGVSPRGSQALYRAAQALALVEGREYVIPDDVKRLATPIFAHRVVINTRATLAPRRADVAERIIEEILSRVEVPL